MVKVVSHESSVFRSEKESEARYVVPQRKELRIATFGFGLGADSDGKGKEIDEAFGVLRIVTAHGEAGQIGAIERERRLAAGDVERALPELEADGTGDTLLRNVEEAVESLALRGKPDAVVNEFG